MRYVTGVDAEAMRGMGILRLNNDAILAQPFAGSIELTSRVTGNTLPLDGEQGIVVTLLSEGPVDMEDLVAFAWQKGVRWDRGTMEAFISDLERWGLVDIEDPTHSESFDEEDRTPSDAFVDSMEEDRTPPDSYAPEGALAVPPPLEDRPPSDPYAPEPALAGAPPLEDLPPNDTVISAAPFAMMGAGSIRTSMAMGSGNGLVD